MTVIENYLKPYAAALQLRQQRMEVLASNIANAATPNFKARDIDFASEYERALSGKGTLTSTNKGHLKTTTGGPTEISTVSPFPHLWMAIPLNCTWSNFSSLKTAHVMRPRSNFSATA